ncbi:hypothetical protein [Methylobacterium sp. GC_Met_2]|uniref:hypothetical protein n=1 Tax=Methylobacterium sp. GC_Met_2 TaxID=2937376 RepID=UPI00226BBB4D|nr:hypothetical protein [Methylobacterium sp. GC_Met_2]
MQRYVLGQNGRVAAITPIALPAPPPIGPFDLVAPWQPGVVEGMTVILDAQGSAVFGAGPAAPAPTAAELLDYASLAQDLALSKVQSFDVAASGQPAHVVTTRLDAKGQFAMLKVQGWLQLNAQNAAATMPYSNVDYSATSLTVSEADSLVDQAAALDTRSYAILNQVAAGIAASPPTITTTAQIDAAFAALVPAAAA